MKNTKLRSICFCLLLIASLGSYAYINAVRASSCDIKCEAKQHLLESDENKSSADLPDVKLFKKLIEKGKELMPSTQF